MEENKILISAQDQSQQWLTKQDQDRQQILEKMYKIRENLDTMLSSMEKEISTPRKNEEIQPFLPPIDPDSFQIHVIEEKKSEVVMNKPLFISFIPKNAR